jgi:hypothetical protein
MISKDKTYKTRDGHEVRIYATDGIGHQCVHGAYRDIDGAWCMWLWSEDGKASILDTGMTGRDLIEVKPRIKRTVWLNVFRNGEVVSTPEPPDHYITTRFACVKVEIDCEEGEGL